MYFKSRIEASKQLIPELTQYKSSNITIIAFSDGGAVIGIEIARALHCSIAMLLAEPIELPGEPDPLALIDHSGAFTYNPMYSPGELEEFDMEYHHYIEQLKLDKLYKMHRLVGDQTLVNKDRLRGHDIIIVSDGFNTGFSLKAAMEYLKTIKIGKVIVATPIASVAAMDRMHLWTDEVHCLSVIDNYMDTNHYYDDNTLPTHEQLIDIITNISKTWV